jgi:uncharacterized membrane protein
MIFRKIILVVIGLAIACTGAHAQNEETIANDEAESLIKALGEIPLFKIPLLEVYLDTCKVCEFREVAQAQLALARALRSRQEADKLLIVERAAAFRHCVTHCDVCEFAEAALSEIDKGALDYESRLFRLSVCNKSRRDLSVAIVGRRDPIADEWTSEGWWNVSAGQCKEIGTFAKDALYYYASDTNGDTWHGDSPFCVSDKSFTIFMYDGKVCSEGQENFGELSGIDKSSWTLKFGD